MRTVVVGFWTAWSRGWRQRDSLRLPPLISPLQLSYLQGMGSPATADEADDSYRTPGVGRSLPNSHDTKQQSCPNGREGRVGDRAWSAEERCVRALLIQRVSGNVTDCTYEQEICR